ncbi:hypothetical protein [Streptomyces sp. NPDC002328]|uniref:hypothetical protein n=1 Tax=Streptomyces sp. NPDC002328 TaxID=3364642 RepID=UPI0036747795
MASGSPPGPSASDGALPEGDPVGVRRKTNVPSETTSPEPASALSGCPSPTRGSGPGGVPQDTLRSWSPPKPDWWERSAPHADAGSGRLPYCCCSAGTGSSSKKCGPVSSTEAGAPDDGEGGGASGSPPDGAGRLVPGTQEAPFQYRT